MSERNVEEAVQLFLGEAANTEQALRQLASFLLRLQGEGWTQSDLREVQARALAQVASHGRQAGDQSE